MRIYNELADWYPLVTPLGDYRDEAPAYRDILLGALGPGRHVLLELGCGAGHNAHWMQDAFDLTLVDAAPAMLAHARRNCPHARCLVGDMRTVRLGRTFDAVFVHDAIAYMATEADLRALMATVAVHLRPGGAALLAPDHTTETFTPGTDHEAHDDGDRALSYLECTWQRPGRPNEVVVDFVMAMRTGEAEPVLAQDRHVFGLFPRAQWMALLAEAGLEPRPCPHVDPDFATPLLAIRREV
ncbi:MAG: class I SAM-dependent methyltransferase [Deltaproteobacteria bacterium]|nr:class I SAM-dependent methyltransferase [Deltaproteobacteria bacterium]